MRSRLHYFHPKSVSLRKAVFRKREKDNPALTTIKIEVYYNEHGKEKKHFVNTKVRLGSLSSVDRRIDILLFDERKYYSQREGVSNVGLVGFSVGRFNALRRYKGERFVIGR